MSTDERLITDLQYVILKMMIVDQIFSHRCSLHLEKDYFNNKYLSWLFEKSKAFVEKHSKPPDVLYLRDQINVHIVEQEKFHYIDSLCKVEAATDYDKQYVIDQLEKFIQTSEFKRLHVKSAELFNSKDYVGAFDYVRKQMTKIDNIKLKNDDYVTGLEIDEILRKSKTGEDLEEVDIMGCAFPKWNNKDTWNGKIPKQGVSTVIAPWNSGKTTFMINCAYHAAKSGKKVLFVFHEGRKAHIVRQFLARITGIPYNAIKAGLLDQSDLLKIENAKVLIESCIRIKEITKVGNTVEDLVIYAKTVKQDFDFDLLVDDYAQKLGTKRPKKELRHEYLYIWNTLDQLAHELNIAVLTAAQVNREGSKKNKVGESILRSENISETIAPAQVSDFCFTINRSSKDKVEDKLILCLDKTRDGLDGFLIECSSMFSRSLTHDPAFGMKMLGFDVGEGRDGSQFT